MRTENQTTISRHASYVDKLSMLPGERLVKALTLNSDGIAMSRGKLDITYKQLNEFVIRFSKGQRTDGTLKRNHRKIDAVLFVEPGNRALCQKWDFTVGVEVKVTSRDLLNDEKIPHYLGWTDFFFLASPDDLIEQTLTKASISPYVGVVSLDSGKIYKYPVRQDVSLDRKVEVMTQAFYKHGDNRKSILLEV